MSILQKGIEGSNPSVSAIPEYGYSLARDIEPSIDLHSARLAWPARGMREAVLPRQNLSGSNLSVSAISTLIAAPRLAPLWKSRIPLSLRAMAELAEFGIGLVERHRGRNQSR